MSRFYPRAEYAEDQVYAHTILTGHVLSRAFVVGTGAGLGIGTIAHLAKSSKPATTTTSVPLDHPLLRPRPTSLKLLQSAGYGSFVGVVLLSVVLTGMMRGKDEIEWKDRSWRLLQNNAQVETDNWIGLGALAGLGTVLSPPVLRRYGGMSMLGWRGVLGGAAVGSIAGLVGLVGSSRLRRSSKEEQ